jgi:hypothetical protein
VREVVRDDAGQGKMGKFLSNSQHQKLSSVSGDTYGADRPSIFPID